jgi:peptidoglycan/LPS O-acetylase OafA/YrhL
VSSQPPAAEPTAAEPTAGTTVAPAAHPFDFPCFDGLRAIAVVSAMLGHVGFVTGAEFSRHEWYAPLVARLEMGPAIFFMMSGFLLYRAYCAAAFAGRSATAPRVFFRRRALRIAPAYWLALTGTLLLHHATTVSEGHAGGFASFTWPQVLALYSLTHIYSAHWFFAGMTQSYTLAVEITFYLMLPVYAVCMRRLGAGREPDARLRLELTGVAALYLVSIVWLAVVSYGGVLPSIAQHWLPGYLDIFGLGMAMAAVHAWSAHTGRKLEPLEWLGRRGDLCLAGGIACFLIVALGMNLPRGVVDVTGGRAYVRDFFHSCGAGFLVLPAVFGPQDRSLFRRFLRLQPVVYVGLVSFGAYLWHNNFLEQARTWAGYPLFQGNFMLLFTVTFSLSVIAASISYFLVERPIFERRDRPFFTRRSAAAVSAHGVSGP